jgi:ABC-type transport system involved in cytochrome bd biosynthesis fused ATPase/permease subunit
VEDKEYELLNRMVVKIDEARTYNKISLILSIIFIFQFVYTFFYKQVVSPIYWIMLIMYVIGSYHLRKKFKETMEEYQELKDEYTTRFEDENI